MITTVIRLWTSEQSDVFRVPVAQTPAELQQGLAGLHAIGDGMLFDLRGAPGAHVFNTRDMLVPLDFAILHGATVVGVYYDVVPGLQQVFVTRAEFVLETPAGWLPLGLQGGRYDFG